MVYTGVSDWRAGCRAGVELVSVGGFCFRLWGIAANIKSLALIAKMSFIDLIMEVFR